LKEVAKNESLASKGLELLHEMRSRGIRPNELTYKPIMSWLPPRGRDAQFQELKKLMAEDGVPFTGVFKFYEIRLALKVGDFKKAERLYIEAKKENDNIASSLDGETPAISSQSNHLGLILTCSASFVFKQMWKWLPCNW
jgi:pentatricopeptide repeat protein